MKHTGNHINGQRVDADGNEYEQCTFTDCQIIYSGGEIAKFTGCSFDGCRFALDGAAARTIAYVQGWSRAGNTHFVSEVVKAITVTGGN